MQEHNIQVRHVPEAVHRQLKARAAQAGMTLSDYVLAELESLARRPTVQDVLERIRSREPVRVRLGAARAVRAERESRR